MHVHGHSAYVLAAGNGDILAADGSLDPSKVQLNLEDPPLSDTTAVPQALASSYLGGSAAGASDGAMSAPAPSPSSGEGGGSMGSMGGKRRKGRKLAQGDGMASMGSTNNTAADSTTTTTLDGYSVLRFTADNPGVW